VKIEAEHGIPKR